MEVDARKRIVEPHIGGFANYRAWKGKRVLEVGCGIGTDTERFFRHGAEVTAIDLSPQSVALTRQRLSRLTLHGPQPRLLQGNAEELAAIFAGETFDLVYSFGVIHHTPNPVRIIEGMRELSHDDTVCKIMVYNKYSWKTMRLTGGRFWREDLVAKQSEAQSGSPITRTYSAAEIEKVMRSCDFRISRITKDHIFPYKIEPYKRYRYEELPLAKLSPSAWHWAESHWGWHLMVEAVPC